MTFTHVQTFRREQLMFEKIYKTVYVTDKEGNVICDMDGNKLTRTVKRTPAEIRGLPKEDLYDLNLIHKKWSKGRFLSMRLNSFIARDGKRVTNVLLELGTTDNNDKLKDCNQIYMDLPKFTWFCELLKSGRMRERVETECEKVRQKALKEYKNAVAEAKKQGLEKPDASEFIPTQREYSVVVFDDYGGNEAGTVSRVLKVYTGWDMKNNRRNNMICFEAGKGPGKKDRRSGGITPYGWNSSNSTKVMVGFTDDELGVAGEMGLSAMRIVEMWSASGKLEENLELINLRKETKDFDSNGAYQSSGSYNGQNQRGNKAARPQQRDNYNNGSGYYNGGYA